ncbi:alkylation response protein AidB-like acyl-CoA dehydrogenase [Roseovarius halotolerans]|uniref:(R)-benzylsuccinyl-CoA dehydrogenase n=1 Tax=Roseovarius halotolerans TaxID=505353 RepID=A0A1X6Y7S6_9RHOB|nr:acyl-CoA dehydrogenase family protein [Roseovarius halotolerans]RKT35159.1 alkylation response protein AidB-like acyl-CoA dehydrogenase [Roseovarius halotolerans]SLN12902.1 (R)-benzylsuccinyl-CoA dehydrogenase [Roseovarius halotolerans]
MIRFDIPDDETLLLRDTAERFVADHYGLAQRNVMLEQPPEQVPPHWGEMAELGWLAAAVPEAAGGLGLSAAQLVPMLEVLGRGLVLEPVGPVAMKCAATLARALPDAGAELEPILSGERIALVAEGAPGAPVSAVKTGGALVLSGVAPLVMAGPWAQVFWVVAELDGAPVLMRIPAEAADVTPVRLVDGQVAARVCFDGVRCAQEDVVTGCAEALAYGRDMALVGVLAEMSGLVDALHGATLDYVKLREQFGRAIGRFQVVQHRMSEMFIRREEVHSMARLAAEAMEGDDAAFRGKLVSAARVKIAKDARVVMRDAVQLHGGIGVTDELAVGHMLKRLLVLSQVEGGRASHLKRFRALIGL